MKKGESALADSPFLLVSSAPGYGVIEQYPAIKVTFYNKLLID
ncbi:hypothetical protein PRUB_b1320 [Pseudoalteromonas rubra]|uniref:Uncharacterized protein n=1 Tax=Pseudoalteromonas rubra TaxID=43658 RepID=A0A8T0C2Q1_9GAMM|nr:hypothetical protein PRUB_b1320 [Pseudoalteromonas rubra]